MNAVAKVGSAPEHLRIKAMTMSVVSREDLGGECRRVVRNGPVCAHLSAGLFAHGKH